MYIMLYFIKMVEQSLKLSTPIKENKYIIGVYYMK